MAREEAIKILNELYDIYIQCHGEEDIIEISIDSVDIEALYMAIKALEQEPTTKNNLEVDCIDRAELLKAMDTWDKFGDDPNKGLIPLKTPTLQDKYVPYVKYDDMINCVKGMPPVTSQEPILDKIRAEIEHLTITEGGEDYIRKMAELYSLKIKILQIIDKYKAEVEPQESEEV